MRMCTVLRSSRKFSCVDQTESCKSMEDASKPKNISRGSRTNTNLNLRTSKIGNRGSDPIFLYNREI